MRIKHLKTSFISKTDGLIHGVADLMSYIKIIIFHFLFYDIFNFPFIMVTSNLVNSNTQLMKFSMIVISLNK